MEVEISGPFNKLSTEDLEVMDDVVQSFCEAVDVVLKTNFKSQKKDPTQMQSVSRGMGIKAQGATKNQKIAAVFCRQWLAGVLSELTHKLVDDTSDRYNYETVSKIMSPHLLDDGADITNPDDIGICIENARICGNGQIEVNYDLDPSAVPPHLKPKLKTQELAQLILQGKQTEQDMIQKLENFWCDVPALLSQHLSQVPEQEGHTNSAEKSSEPITATGTNQATIAANDKSVESSQKCAEESVLIDDSSLELLENIANGVVSTNDSEAIPEDMDVPHKLQYLKKKAEELGVKGMDQYISLYNRVNKEVTNINRLAKFFSKLANDYTASHR